MRIFLSVGHSILRGGDCTSANGYVNEYRYCKELAPYVKKELEQVGHSCDIIVCPENRFSNMREERNYKLPIANSGKYNLVCELHLNASNGSGNGSEVLCYGDSKGLTIAKRGAESLSKLGFKDRGAKVRKDLYIISQTNPTAVLFETFFCDNKKDTDIAKSVGFEKIAKAICVGLVGGTSSIKTEQKVEVKKDSKLEGRYFVMTDTPNDVLNVREQANATSKIVSSYRDGSKIYVHEVVKNNTGTWYKIEYHEGKFGYVSARYCKGI